MGSNHMHEILRDNNRFLEQGDRKSIRGNQFRNGISIPLVFKLGDKFKKNIQLSSSSLKFVLSSKLYYGKEVFRKNGQSLAYYGQEKNWDENISKNIAKVFFDLRDAIPNKNKFDFNQINDGHGNYGENCIINLIATYEIN